MTIILLSFLVEELLKRGVNFFALDSFLCGFCPTSSSPCPLSSRASSLLCKWTWGGGMGRKGAHLWHWARTCFHSSPFLRSPPSAQQLQGRASSVFWVCDPGVFLSGMAGSDFTSLTPAPNVWKRTNISLISKRGKRKSGELQGSFSPLCLTRS